MLYPIKIYGLTVTALYIIDMTIDKGKKEQSFNKLNCLCKTELTENNVGGRVGDLIWFVLALLHATARVVKVNVFQFLVSAVRLLLVSFILGDLDWISIFFFFVFLYFQVKQMKETADKTLSKVRREIRETRKMLDTVNRLQKLRAVRNDTAEKRGTNVFIIIKGCTCLLTCMLLFLYKKIWMNLSTGCSWMSVCIFKGDCPMLAFLMSLFVVQLNCM